MAFDPNKETAKGLWATYIPNRSPAFKVHTNRGHATSAIKCKAHWGEGCIELLSDEIKLYRRTSAAEQWQEVELRRAYLPDESILAHNEE